MQNGIKRSIHYRVVRTNEYNVENKHKTLSVNDSEVL